MIVNRCGGCGKELVVLSHGAMAACCGAGYWSTFAPLAKDRWWPVVMLEQDGKVWYKYIEQARRRRCL